MTRRVVVLRTEFANQVYRGEQRGFFDVADTHPVSPLTGTSDANAAVPVDRTHCLERTFIITETPNGVQFSHPLVEQVRGDTPARADAAYDNLFREPDFAPGTPPATFPEPAPVRHRRDGRNHPPRTNRRRNAA